MKSLSAASVLVFMGLLASVLALTQTTGTAAPAAVAEPAGFAPVPISPILKQLCINACWDNYHDAIEDAEEQRDDAIAQADQELQDERDRLQNDVNNACPTLDSQAEECIAAQVAQFRGEFIAMMRHQDQVDDANATYDAAVLLAQEAVNDCLAACDGGLH